MALSTIQNTKLVLLALHAPSKVRKIHIYDNKFLFQNIELAGSKGFWYTLNCLKSQKFLAGVRFSILDFVKMVWLVVKCSSFFFFPESVFSFFGDLCKYRLTTAYNILTFKFIQFITLANKNRYFLPRAETFLF